MSHRFYRSRVLDLLVRGLNHIIVQIDLQAPILEEV